MFHGPNGSGWRRGHPIDSRRAGTRGLLSGPLSRACTGRGLVLVAVTQRARPVALVHAPSRRRRPPGCRRDRVRAPRGRRTWRRARRGSCTRIARARDDPEPSAAALGDERHVVDAGCARCARSCHTSSLAKASPGLGRAESHRRIGQGVAGGPASVLLPPPGFAESQRSLYERAAVDVHRLAGDGWPRREEHGDPRARPWLRHA